MDRSFGASVRIAGAVMLVAGVVAFGCGKKGPPMPPEPRGPLAPLDVRSRQIGEDVVVSFVVPRPRGDEAGQRPASAELVRVVYAPGVEARSDPDAFRRRGEVVATVQDGLDPGAAIGLADPSRAELTDGGTGSTLRYAVRVRDVRGRPSPLVAARDLVPLPVIPPPRALAAEPVGDGVRLAWQAPDAPGPLRYHVYRGQRGQALPSDPIEARPVEEPTFLDTTAQPGVAYSYFVRVATGEGEPLRESASSNTVDVVAEDRFAPSAPLGVVAVQEASAVRLFWNPAPERDVVGYRVYRRAAGSGEAWKQVGPDPVREPLYLDEGVAVGESWEYVVAAIDRAVPPNESATSSPVEVELLAEPASGPSAEGA